MDMEKIGALLCAVFTMFVLMGAVESAVWGMPAAHAAKGGSFRMIGPRVSTPKISPKPAAPKKSNAAGMKQAEGVSRPAASASSGSAFGGFLRGMGIFAGGMMLGNLLSGMLGWETMGGLSTIFGLLFNLVIYGLIIKLVFWAIRRFFGGRGGGDPYHNRMSYADMNVERRAQNGDWGDEEIPDIRPPQRDKGGTDYEPSRTADWYRRH